MQQPRNYTGARDWAFSRLANELDPIYQYHSIAHTVDDVFPAAVRLARLSHLPEDEVQLVGLAAAYHDIGFVEQAADHEAFSVRIMRETLPRFGFSADEIEQIAAAIMATKLPQYATTLYGQLLADADLDVLGRDDFWARNQMLLQEFRATGRTLTDDQWLMQQINFVQGHEYFTAEAKILRNPGKMRNVKMMMARLASRKTAIVVPTKS